MKKNYIYPPVPTSKIKNDWYGFQFFRVKLKLRYRKYNERVEECRASSDAITPSKLIAQLGEFGPAEFNSSSYKIKAWLL